MIPLFRLPSIPPQGRSRFFKKNMIKPCLGHPSIAAMCRAEGISIWKWWVYRRQYPKRPDRKLLRLIKAEENREVLLPVPSEPYVMTPNGVRWYPYNWTIRDRERTRQ